MPADVHVASAFNKACTGRDQNLLKFAYDGFKATSRSQNEQQAASPATLLAGIEAALKVQDLKLAEQGLREYFDVYQGAASDKPGQPAATAVHVRALFAAGRYCALQSSSLKGQQLVSGVLEAVAYILQGLEAAATHPRMAPLIYNGSVYYWQASRPLQRDALRRHLLPSQERVCALLEKAAPGGPNPQQQQEWLARQLVQTGLAQWEVGRGEDAGKTLARALELATKGSSPELKRDLATLQTHMQSLVAAKIAAGAAGGKGAVGGKPASAGKTTTAGMAAAARPQSGATGGRDVEGALTILQWAASTKPDPPSAEQQLKEAWQKVDPQPNGPSKGVPLALVGRISWWAAVLGCQPMAEQCAARAATSQELLPRMWSDMTRVLLSLPATPSAVPPPAPAASVKAAAGLPAGYKEYAQALEALDEVVTSMMRLKDVEGVHYAAKLIWNAGLPLLQPSTRRYVKRAFAAAAKALQAVSSPLSQLRAQLHLECGKCEAADDALLKAAKEVQTALSLDYPPPAASDLVTAGLDRPLDRWLNPMARAFALKADLQPPGDSGGPAGEDELVVLLERARDCKNPSIRSDYLLKALDRLMTLPPCAPPEAPAAAAAATAPDGFSDPAAELRRGQHWAARRRSQLLADLVQAAMEPCELEALVRVLAPYALTHPWAPAVDPEMVLLQARVRYWESQACAQALKKLAMEVLPPPGYQGAAAIASTAAWLRIPAAEAPPAAAGGAKGGKAKELSPADAAAAAAAAAAASVLQVLEPVDQRGAPEAAEDGVRLPSGTDEQLQWLFVQDLLEGMQQGIAIKQAWMVANGAAMAWNAYLPVMQQQRHGELGGVLLPLLHTLLKADVLCQTPQQQAAGAGCIDVALICKLAEAAAKSAEHLVLLRLLASPVDPAAAGTAAEGDAAAAEEEVDEPPVAPDQVLEYREGALPWYTDLIKARHATGAWDVAARLNALQLPSGSALLVLLDATAEACQAALSKAASVGQPQALLQAVARLQQLRGQPMALPAGMPAAVADASKALAAVQALVGAPAPDGPAAMAKVQQDIQAAMALLKALPTVNLQLWAQLAQAAGSKGFWPLARNCAEAAVGALPPSAGSVAAAVAAPQQVAGWSRQDWFWLGVAEWQHGLSILALVQPHDQDAATQLALRRQALDHLVPALQSAAVAGRSDLAEAVAVAVWNGCGALLSTAPTKATLAGMLQAAAQALNATKPRRMGLQVQFNCLLMDCLAAAGRWEDLTAAADGLRAMLPVAELAPVVAWKAVALAHGQHRVLEGMTRLQADFNAPDIKARAWQTFAQNCSHPYDQLASRRNAVAALEASPLQQVEYQLEFAEWAAASGLEDGAAVANQLLLEAAQVLQQHELDQTAAAAPPRKGGDTPLDSTLNSTSSKATLGRKRRASLGATQVKVAEGPGGAAAAAAARRRSSCTEGCAVMVTKARARRSTGNVTTVAKGPGVSNKPASGKVGAQQLQQLVRVFTVLSKVADDPHQRQQHLHTAQLYITKLLTAAIESAAAKLPAPKDPKAEEAATAAAAAAAAAEAAAATAAAAAAAAGGKGSPAKAGAKGAAAAPAAAAGKAGAGAPAAAAGAAAATDAASAGNGVCAQAVPVQVAALLPTAAGDAVTSTCTPPSSTLGWATWQPSQELLAALSSDSGPSSLNRDVVGVHAEVLLSCCCAVLEDVAASGLLPQALPVAHLLRLVALITGQNKVLSKALTLKLAELCERMGMSAAAAHWLATAAPDAEPDHHQLQAVAEEVAVHELVAVALGKQDAASGTASASSSLPGGSAGRRIANARATKTPSSRPDSGMVPGRSAAAVAAAAGTLPPHAGFLTEVLQAVDPALLSLWRTHGCSTHSGAAAAGGEHGAGPGQQAPRQQAPWLQHWGATTAWLLQAEYLVGRGQGAAAERLLGLVLQHARAVKDTLVEARVLLLQSQLLLLAGQPDEAAVRVQAAQAAGGAVRHLEESVVTYCRCRLGSRDGGERDALAALEGGVEVLAAVIRSDPVAAAEARRSQGRLQLELVRLMGGRSERLRGEGEPVAAARELDRGLQLLAAATESLLHQGAGLEYVEALLLRVELLQAQQRVHQPLAGAGRGGSAGSSRRVPKLGKRPADERAHLRKLLEEAQVAEAAALLLLQQSWPDDTPPGFAGLPAAAALARARLQEARVCLQLAQADARHTTADAAAKRPKYPKILDKDAAVVEGYVDGEVQQAQEAQKQGQDEDNHAAAAAAGHLSWVEQATLFATAAVEVAADPSTRAAALALQGEALLHQAIMAMPPAAAGAAAPGTCSSKHPAAKAQEGSSTPAAVVDQFERAWLPWPGPAEPDTAAAAAAEQQQEQAPPEASATEPGSGPNSGDAAVQPAVAAAAAPAPAAGAGTPLAAESAAGAPEEPPRPALSGTAQELQQQAVAVLQSALSAAVAGRCYAAAQKAALALFRCHGLLAPEAAADCLAVAQSAAAANWMREEFCRAASPQHPEVLTWRQLQQLQSNVLQPSSATQQQQADQILASLGVTHQRLAVGAGPLLQPLVNVLPGDLRVLLVHYSSELQQLLVLGLAPDPTDPAAVAGAGADKAKAKDPKAAAGAAAAPPAKRISLLGSIKLTEDQMVDLVRGFKEYRQWLQRYVLELSSVPLEGTMSAAGAAAAAAAEAEAAAAAADQGGKGSPGKKGAAGAKGSPAKGAKPDPKAKGAAADAGAGGPPPWIPAGKVYGTEPNQRWKELLVQFEALLQPLAPLINQTLAPGPAPAAPAAGKPGATATTPDKPQLLLLVDPQLCPLPWEAVGVLKGATSGVGRCFSAALLQQVLLGGSTEAGAAPAAAQPTTPEVDLVKVSYVVDPLHEQSSTVSRAPGAYEAKLIPGFQQKVLEVYGKEWQGLKGQPDLVPAQGVYSQLVGAASTLLYCGLGRFLSYMDVQVLGQLDLSGCGTALLFDRSDNAAAAQRQLSLDNRKLPAGRHAEGVTHTAMLLLLRGVKTVALVPGATTAHYNLEMAQGLLQGLTAGQTLGQSAAAAAKRLQEAGCELDSVVARGLVLYGVPHAVAAEAGGKGKGGAAAKAKK